MKLITKNLISCALIFLAVASFESCKKNGDANCNTNTSTNYNGKEICFTGSVVNYTSGTLPNGEKVEEFRMEFVDVTGFYFKIYMKSTSMTTAQNIQEFKTDTEYFTTGNAYPEFVNNVSIKNNGSFKFTKYDRTARKISGTFTFTYVENTSSGNVEKTVSGSFNDVSY